MATIYIFARLIYHEETWKLTNGRGCTNNADYVKKVNDNIGLGVRLCIK